MLSSVLNSERAIAINVEIMCAFVKLRDLLSSNRELARRFAQPETRLGKKLTEHDEAIAAIPEAAAADGAHPAPPQSQAAVRNGDGRYGACPAGPLKSAAKKEDRDG